MGHGKLKVAIVHNIVAPYRIPLFEGLSKAEDIDLHLLYCAETHSNRLWNINEHCSFSNELLPGWSIEVGFITFHFNPIICKKIIQEDYDVVIIGGLSDFTMQLAAIACRITNTPVILWSEGTANGQHTLGKILNPLTKLICSFVKALVVPGFASKNFFSRYIDSSKIFLAPDAVDNDSILKISQEYKGRKVAIKEEMGLNNKKLILFVGRIVDQKGVEYLVEAYASLKKKYQDLCLILVGEGENKKMIQKQCEQQSIADVIFTGWVSEDDKIKYYSISDVFVLPTLYDVWGLVVNEAMICGLPIITTTAAGCSTDLVVHGKNGYVVDPMNSKKLENAINSILSNCEDSKKMGDYSYYIINNNYNMSNSIKGFQKAIYYAAYSNQSRNHD